MTKPIILLPVILIIVVAILAALLQFTSRPNERPNGFVRQWDNWIVDSSANLEHFGRFNDICGTTDEYIFLTTRDPRWLIRLSRTFDRMDSVAFGLPYSQKMIGASQTVVEPPATYYFSNNFPGVFRGRWDIKRFDTLYQPSTTFTRSARMPPDHILIRAFDPVQPEIQLVQKININSGKIEASNPLFLEQQMGGFDKDGILLYDSLLKRVFYIEQYRNKFYCLDTLLRPIYTGSTIDTFEVNPVEIEWVTIDGERRLMPSKPRTLTNGDCYISGDFLFVRSQLRSDNQTIMEFKKNVSFDTYSTKDGSYEGSFSIPLKGKDPLTSFSVHGSLLIALYGRHIATFKITKVPNSPIARGN